jgi:hypothetical protein
MAVLVDLSKIPWKNEKSRGIKKNAAKCCFYLQLKEAGGWFLYI